MALKAVMSLDQLSDITGTKRINAVMTIMDIAIVAPKNIDHHLKEMAVDTMIGTVLVLKIIRTMTKRLPVTDIISTRNTEAEVP